MNQSRVFLKRIVNSANRFLVCPHFFYELNDEGECDDCEYYDICDAFNDLLITLERERGYDNSRYQSKKYNNFGCNGIECKDESCEHRFVCWTSRLL